MNNICCKLQNINTVGNIIENSLFSLNCNLNHGVKEITTAIATIDMAKYSIVNVNSSVSSPLTLTLSNYTIGDLLTINNNNNSNSVTLNIDSGTKSCTGNKTTLILITTINDAIILSEV